VAREGIATLEVALLPSPVDPVRGEECSMAATKSRAISAGTDRNVSHHHEKCPVPASTVFMIGL
jgi:hypothetical protein